ncbi:pyruvate kinase [Gregarina niphandrodes]|uniref:Pyruvate kinase n=1 Tax=Gregarina niphandrodes TaxID=110365 RepID=A0A023B821_GRENI|nr:pyruvate kinase [Gregarina niphandrodes]EZG68161.1 pyruvate kinase [Gregarina niphandrodes]|eukprot:XP_011130055.1 pyruvate kinase [Gregarina niphandrodes]
MNTSVQNSQFMNKAQRIALDDIFRSRSELERSLRRTKIICTMGPACWDVETLVKMIDAGMDVCRLNFSHGDHETHGECLKRVREAMKQRPEKKLGLLLDTKGPEIRTGMFKEGVKAIELKKGQQLKIVTDYNFLGDENCIACTYPKLPQTVKPGSQILIADGSLSVKVMDVQDDHVITEVMNNAKIGERKNMNLPGAKVDLPVCGEREINDFLAFGIPNRMHFIAASFVQCAQDIRDIRKILGDAGRHFKILPKIENQEGLIHFDEILAEADGVMIARGDMGMEIPLEKVFLAQKMIISKCNLVGKPVIVATQMLESMINAPRPTRAEVSDVANAVLDGCDCVMLSGESANGAFPVNAVQMLSRTCLEAESCLDYPSLYKAIHSSVTLTGSLSVPEAVCCSAVESAEDVNASCIIALTETGLTARLLAKYKPPQIILAVSASDISIAQLSFVRGVIPIKVDSFQGTDSIIRKAVAHAKDRKYAKPGDSVVCVHGILEDVSGHTNLMKIVNIQ